GDDVARPRIRPLVRAGELVEREGLADALAELVRHDVELQPQSVPGHRISGRRLEAAVAVLPLSPDGIEHEGHAVKYPLLGAANRRPERLELRDDALAQLVARPRERECDVSVQALQAAGAGARAADAEVELRPQRALLR